MNDDDDDDDDDDGDEHDNHDPANGAGLNLSFRTYHRSTGAAYCLGGRFRDVDQVASDRAKPASQKATKVMREGLNNIQLHEKLKLNGFQHFKHLTVPIGSGNLQKR